MVFRLKGHPVSQHFNYRWNKHYDFDDDANIAEISKVESYDISDDASVYAEGAVIKSPWGRNRVLSLSKARGEDVCVKEITVNPGHMLSLQRHRGRSEYWEVLQGTLGVIRDGEYINVPAGSSIAVPKGAVHCMINATGSPVVVRETQRGICREKDNVRLADMNDRPLYPLESEAEYKSFMLYERLRSRLEGGRMSDRDLFHAPLFKAQGDASGL